MDFSLSEEQRLLRDSAQRYGAENFEFSAWRARAARAEPLDRQGWAKLADLGWLALNVPEDDGGLAATPVETMLICEAIGRNLMLEPFISSCVIAPALLANGGSPLCSELLAAIATGETLVSLADAEPDGRFDLGYVATKAEAIATGGYRLTGLKSHVMDGAGADWFIIPARTSGAPEDAAGISLFLVRSGAAGLVVEQSRAMDNRLNASLRLEGVVVEPGAVIGQIGAEYGRLTSAVDAGIVAQLAEAVGAMDAAYEMTLAYLKTRKQFGQPIGTFQSLQHRAVDMAIACEEARSIMYLATLSLSQPERERRRMISAAKTRVGQTSLFVGRQAVQLHGGIGFTEELAIGHYLKRLIMADVRFGNADHHRSRVAELSAAK